MYHIRKIAIIVLTSCTSIFAFAVNPVIVATDPAFPPFSYLNELGEPAGFDVDLIKLIAEKGSIPIRVVPEQWSRWPKALDDGQVDIWAAGIAVKEERKDKVDYSMPYLTYRTAALVRKDNLAINAGNIAEYHLAAVNGTVDLEMVKDLVENDSKRFLPVKTDFLGMKNVALGKVDAIIGNDKVLGFHNQSSGNDLFRIFPLENGQDGNQLGFTFKKDNQGLVNKINAGLMMAKQDGSYNRLCLKWFGSSCD